MALLVKDRIKETTSTTGTGTLTLAGAVAGYQAFSVLGDGATTYYALTDANGTAWEVGLGTYASSGTTLARTTVLGSSNSGSKITLTSGTHDVFVTYPADKAGFNDEGLAKTFTASGTITAGKPCILEADGDAAQIVETGNTVTGGTGTANSFNGSNAINYVSTSLAKVADDKVAVAYRDASNSNYGVVRVATVDDSGRTIAFGTAVVVNSVASNGTGVAYDTSRSVLGVTVQTESDPKLIIANYTISGTALTKQGSSLTLISSDEVKAHTALFDPDNNHIMVFLVYVNGSDRTFRAVAVTGNASGTPTSSYLVNVNVDTTFFDMANPFFATYDTNVNAFFVTSNKSEPSTFRAVVVTNSGSAITATERSKTKPTNYKEKPAICFDSNNNKVVLAYNTTSNYNEIVNITMTANDFTLGTPTAVTSLGTGASDSVSAGFASFDPTAQRVVILRGGGGAATSRWAVFSNDGTDFTQQSTGVWDSSTNNFAQRGGILQTAMTTNMTSNPIPIVMSDGNTGYAYSAVFTVGQTPVTNLDDNYLGVAATSASNTEEVKINLPDGSINNSQSGLTIGDDYFSDGAGNIKQFMTSTTTTSDTPTGSHAQVVTNTTGHMVSSVYESNSGTFSIAFKDTSNSSYGTVVCGTESNGTFTWGTPVVFESSAIDSQPTLAAGGNRIHVAYRASDDNGGIRSASISGTTPTFAAETIFAPTGGEYAVATCYHLAYDTSTNYVIILYKSYNGSAHKAWVQPVYHDTSDGTYTSGTASALFTGQLIQTKSCAVFDPDTNRTVIAYTDGSNSDYPTANVVQSTGSSGSPTVTIGADTLLNGSSASDDMDIVYDTTNNKAVIFFDDQGGGNIVKAVIGTVTGGGTNTIAVNSPTTIWDPSGNPNYWAAGYDGDKNRIQYFYHDEDSGDDFTYKVITPTASTLTVATGGVLSANQNKMGPGSTSFGTGKGVLCATEDSNNSGRISYGFIYYADVVTYTQTDSQFIGKALSATALELKEQNSNIIYGRAGNAITAGKPIIVQTDGELAQVDSNSQTTNYTYSKGTETELVAGNMLNTVQSCYDENVDRFVVAYMDGDVSNYGRAVVVSTSGTTPTVTATATFDAVSYGAENPIPVYDSVNKKVVIIYQAGNDSNKGESIVATVAASAITFGTSVQYNTSSQGGSGSRHAYFDEANEKIVLFGKDQSNSNYPTVWIGTVSGTSITWGSGVVVESSGITDTCAARYSSGSGKGLFVWEDTTPNGQAIVGTVSGTSMTFGSKLQFTTENINSSFSGKVNPLCYDSVADKFLFLYQISSGDDGEGIVFTISGTSVTAGAETNLHDNWTNTQTIGKSDFGKIPIIYRNSSNHAYYAEVTITGTTPALSGEAVLNSGTTYFNGLSLDTTQGDIKLLATYEDSSNDLASTVIIPNGTRTVSTPNLTTENFVGIANEAATENATVKVKIGGVDANQSELTAGQLYYVKNDGTLSTTAETDKTVEAGKALSATKLLVNTS